MTAPLETHPATEPAPVSDPVLTLGNLLLNLDTYEATIDGWPIELSYNEFELLCVLAAERNRVLPYEVIVQRLWKDSGHGSVRHLHVVVHRVRSKLSNLRPFEIRTVRGRGYGLVQPIGRVPEATTE